MGYGPVVGGRQQRITPWENSWAYQETMRRLFPPLQWLMAANSAREAGRPFCAIKPSAGPRCQ